MNGTAYVGNKLVCEGVLTAQIVKRSAESDQSNIYIQRLVLEPIPVIRAIATIGADVVIGNNCWIGPYVTIMDGSRVGNSCKIFPGQW